MGSSIVALNAGSSSLKFAVYDARDPQAPRCRGQLEGIGASPHLKVVDADGRTMVEEAWPRDELDRDGAARQVFGVVLDLVGRTGIAGVGHRVVHGGVRYAGPVRIDAEVVAGLRALVPLAPLHQPHNLAPIEAILRASPQTPQVACFDTAFHRVQPELAQMFALPRRFTEAGVRRYGFHGLSYEYIAGRLGDLAPDLARGRVVVAHLGSGASLCGMRGGRSVATTMGFTPLDGLMMGTRCGALDPGVLLHLMDVHGLDARAIENLLYRESGLLGVSGLSSDMRQLQASADPHAADAVALFVYRVVREIGAMAAALGGLDGLVFTGGIGEHDGDVRARVAAGCLWMGLDLDHGRNATGEGRIHRDGSRVQAWVVPTDEELMVVRHTQAVLGLAQPRRALTGAAQASV